MKAVQFHCFWALYPVFLEVTLVIELPGLVLPPEGDLIIDTELMTVTLNGQDVTRYFGADSEFFRLRPGENIIIHEDGAQKRNVSYKILWKDMWL